MSSETNEGPSGESHPEPEVTPHPDYSDQGSDLILITNDGKQFFVHSLIMKLASGMFRAMIDASPANASRKEPIHVQESGDVIKDLLDIIYPNKLSFADTPPAFAHFKDVCCAAEKYEMDGALHIMKLFFRMMINTFPPLLAFALASRYEWAEELRLASTATLKLDLYSSQSTKDLQFVPSRELLRLMELHRKRRNLLVESLDLVARPGGLGGDCQIQWSSVLCDGSRCTVPSDHFQTPQWTVLKYRISEEMERQPDGSTIREVAFWNRGEFDKIWEAECSGCYRGGGQTGKIMGKYKLMAQVIRVLDILPKTIQ